MKDVKFSLVFLSTLAAMMLMPPMTALFVNHMLRRASFLLPDGDQVTCIPFRHLYPGTTWVPGPSTEPVESMPAFPTTPQSSKQAEQILEFEKRKCNVGEVPVRNRPILAAISGSKASLRKKLESMQSNSWPADKNGHKYAIASIKGSYTGAHGYLNLWQPYVEKNDFSLAQVWVASVDEHGLRYSLEAGWQIYEDLYNDRKPRLFTFWTADNYTTTGCYNLECPGFVQVSNKVLLGGSFAAVSSMNSTQYEIKLQIFRDNATGNWWLQLNDENVGYWPHLLLSSGVVKSSYESTTRIDWGGEIWHPPGQYTPTQMGSGEHPNSAGFRKAAYIRKLQAVDSQNRLVDLSGPELEVLSSFSHCCGMVVHSSEKKSFRNWGTHVFFGGPGYSKLCAASSNEVLHTSTQPPAANGF